MPQFALYPLYTVSTDLIRWCRGSGGRRPIRLLLGQSLLLHLALVVAQALQRPLPLAVRRRAPAARPHRPAHGPGRAPVPPRVHAGRRHRGRLGGRGRRVLLVGEDAEAVLLGGLGGVLLRLRTPANR